MSAVLDSFLDFEYDIIPSNLYMASIQKDSDQRNQLFHMYPGHWDKEGNRLADGRSFDACLESSY